MVDMYVSTCLQSVENTDEAYYNISEDTANLSPACWHQVFHQGRGVDIFVYSCWKKRNSWQTQNDQQPWASETVIRPFARRTARAIGHDRGKHRLLLCRQNPRRRRWSFECWSNWIPSRQSRRIMCLKSSRRCANVTMDGWRCLMRDAGGDDGVR